VRSITFSIQTVNSPDDSTIPLNNRLLAAPPRDEYERLVPRLELVRFPRNRILYEAGDQTRYAYFLNSGIASLVAITEEGQTIEIGTVGREGFIGVPIVHEVGVTPYRVIVQMPADAARIEPHRQRVSLSLLMIEQLPWLRLFRINTGRFRLDTGSRARARQLAFR
jgi:CRP-like cAMP-binding protein